MYKSLSLLRRRTLIRKMPMISRDPHDHVWPDDEPKPHDLQDPPSSEEIVRIHYLKHYPQSEYQNYKDIDVDSYRYYVRYRYETLGFDTDPYPMNPFDLTSIRVYLFFALMPLICGYIAKRSIDNASRIKNEKNGVRGNFLIKNQL